MTFQLEASSTWYNELGSVMVLNADGNGGLTGTYKSAVGTSPVPVALSGRYTLQNPITIGWSVAWSAVNATTSWSGQAIVINGVQTIVTTWLLTSQTSQSDEWESTMIDQDVFTQTPPTEEQIAIAKLRKGKSHYR